MTTRPRKPRTPKPSAVDKKLTKVSQPKPQGLTQRQIDAAVALHQTASGPKTKGGGYEPPPQEVLPVGFNRKPDGTIKTPEEVKQDYPNIDDAQLRHYRQLYNDQVAGRNPAIAQFINRVTDGTSAYLDALTHVPGALAGNSNDIAEVVDLTTLAMRKRDELINQITGRNHLNSQARVGGTKGSNTVVDRSEAVRKAWLTRKKNYGSSGLKDK